MKKHTLEKILLDECPKSRGNSLSFMSTLVTSVSLYNVINASPTKSPVMSYALPSYLVT